MNENSITTLEPIQTKFARLFELAQSEEQRQLVNQLWQDTQQVALIANEMRSQRDATLTEYQSLVEALEELDDNHPIVAETLEGVWETAQEEAEPLAEQVAQDAIYNNLFDVICKAISTEEADHLYDVSLYQPVRRILDAIGDNTTTNNSQRQALLNLVETFIFTE